MLDSFSVCDNCGFDASMDYERNPTLAELPENTQSIHSRRKTYCFQSLVQNIKSEIEERPKKNETIKKQEASSMALKELKDKMIEKQSVAGQIMQCINMMEEIENIREERKQLNAVLSEAMSELLRTLSARSVDEEIVYSLAHNTEQFLEEERKAWPLYHKKSQDFLEAMSSIEERIIQSEAEYDNDLSIPLKNSTDSMTITKDNSIFDQEPQRFRVRLEDGSETDAELLAVVEIDGKDYAVYSIENGDNTVDILASYVLKDNEGYDYLANIENPEDREKIRKYVAELTT